MVKAMDCGIVRTPVTLLRSLSGKYPWERYEPPNPPSYVLNSTTTVLLGEWLWHKIPAKVDMPLNKETKPNFGVVSVEKGAFGSPNFLTGK